MPNVIKGILLGLFIIIYTSLWIYSIVYSWSDTFSEKELEKINNQPDRTYWTFNMKKGMEIYQPKTRKRGIIVEEISENDEIIRVQWNGDSSTHIVTKMSIEIVGKRES